MRIISGIYGRRRFDIPPAFEARPTTDFAKENLFNVLANIIDLDGIEALDLFAGTGSISFELLSRGCASVTTIESNRTHAAFIRKIAATLKTDALHLICGDAFRFINRPGKRKYDLIFADPPYTMKELPEIPSLILNSTLLKENAILILEHSAKHSFTHIPTFRQHREYGSVNFSLFYRKDETEGGNEDN
jgi:16S rRNA (guanine(966)-N(2))-methyltransferase RsmD